jgi:hypothetical protein
MTLPNTQEAMGLKPPPSRVGRILVNAEMFLHLLTGLSRLGLQPDGWHRRVTTALRMANRTIPIPDDIKVVGVNTDRWGQRNTVELFVESAAFDEVPDGVEAPIFMVEDTLHSEHIDTILMGVRA